MESVVILRDVDASNWRAVAKVRTLPEQERFVAPATHYLSLSAYGGEWHSLAIEANGEVVGHVMWAIDPADGSHWIGGLVIDAGSQRKGIGRATILVLIERFRADPNYRETRLSYMPDNGAAQLYRELGFVETGEMDEDEVVARLV